jgi:hypothetical protein
VGTLKADLLSGPMSITGNVGTLAVKDASDANLTVTGKVKSLKTDTVLSRTQPGAETPKITVNGGGTFSLGTGKDKQTFKSAETVKLYTIV